MAADQNPPRNGEGDQVKLGGGGPRILQAPIKQVKRARKLRRELSLPEVMLLKALRRRPHGLKFRSQFPVGVITADFACLSHRLIIEVDGEGHNRGDQQQRDSARDAFLRTEGFEVMRIAARDVLSNLDGVICGIVARCDQVGPLHSSASLSGPPPRAGEDFS